MENVESKIKEIVQRVVAEHLACAPKGFVKNIDRNSGVITVKAATVIPEKFDTGKAGDAVFLSDVVSLEESPRIMFGIMEIKDGSSFDWTLNYDEVDYVIDGTLEIIVDSRTSRAERGEIIFIPKNTAVTFKTPDATRFMYVTYPANWSET